MAIEINILATQALFVTHVNGFPIMEVTPWMNEMELIKAQADLIKAQQNFMSMISEIETFYARSSLHIPESNIDETQESTKKITLSEYAKIFLKSKKSTVKPSTYHNYVWMLEKTILPIIGETELCKIDNRCLQNFADELLEKLAKKSVRDMVGLVKNILADACINGVIEPKKFIIKYPKGEKSDYKVLSEEDFKRLEGYLFLQEKPHDIGELLLLETGMRIGEMCGVKWGDINFDNKTIKIKRTVQRIYEYENKKSEMNVGRTKTSAGERIVPITEKICEHLKKYQKDNEIYVASGRKTPTEPRTHRQYHKMVMKKIGIDYIPPHGLRHTFATRAIQFGVDPKTVSAILGHSNSNITLNIYTSVTADMLRNGIEKMNN